MKFRLLILTALLSVLMAGQTALPEHGLATEGDLVHMPGTPDCFFGASRMGDPTKQASIMKMKGTAGCAVPWHWHPADEHIMMVSGTGQAEVKGEKPMLLQAGDFYSAHAKHVMRFTCVTECSLFVFTDGPFAIHYVDDSGREVPAVDALKKK